MISIIIKKISKIYQISGYIIFFLLIFFDIFSFGKPTFASYGTYLWLLSNLYLILFTIKAVRDLFILVLKGRSIFSLIVIFIFLLTIFLNLTKLNTVSGESSIEIACTLNNLLKSPDRGYWQTCLFGYPDRQFFLSSMLSLKNRNIVNLNLGETLYFIIGIIVFSSGVIKYFKNSFKGDLVNGIFLSSMLHVYYLNSFIFNSRQGMFPFSFGLIIVGLLLYYLSYPEKFPTFLFGFVFLYLIFSYTPSLSIYFFSITTTLFLILNKKITINHKILFTLFVILSLSSFLMSLKIRSDINISSKGTRDNKQLIKDASIATEHLFFQNAGNPYVSEVFNSLFLLLIITPLFFVFGLKGFLISTWTIATIFISVLSRGYAYYGVDFRLHRSIIIFPIIFGLYAVEFAKRQDKLNNKFLIAVFVLLLPSGYFFQKKYLNQAITHVNNSFLFNRLLPVLRQNNHSNIEGNLYFIGETANDFGSINDQLVYFAPKIIANFYPSEIQENCQYLNNGFYIIKKNHPCYEKMTELTNTSINQITEAKVLGAKNNLNGDYFPDVDILKNNINQNN